MPRDQGSKLYGKYRGIVTDDQDPNKLGRVKVRVPAIGDIECGWAAPVFPYAGKNEGIYMIPPVGGGVWVEFEAGDTSRPIWAGCWYGSGEAPENESGKSAEPKIKITRSSEGLLAALDDDKKTLTLSDSDGSNLVVIKASEGQIRIEAKTKVIVEAPQIELVDGASHPVTFGDELLSYLNNLVMIFNTHLHPGELAAGAIPVTPAPPAAPFPSPTPSLYSTKVKSG